MIWCTRERDLSLRTQRLKRSKAETELHSGGIASICCISLSTSSASRAISKSSGGSWGLLPYTRRSRYREALKFLLDSPFGPPNICPWSIKWASNRPSEASTKIACRLSACSAQTSINHASQKSRRLRMRLTMKPGRISKSRALFPPRNRKPKHKPEAGRICPSGVWIQHSRFCSRKDSGTHSGFHCGTANPQAR